MRAFADSTEARGSLWQRAPRSYASVSLVRVVTLLALLNAISCSSLPPSDVRWSVRFVCASLGQRAEQVRVGIARGRCSDTEPPVYEATVFRAGGPELSPPESLPPGPYAFRAIALDDKGVELARGCRAVTLPRDASVTIDLDTPTSCEGGPDGNGMRGAPTGDGGVAADSGPRLELTQTEYLAGQSISVRFVDVTKAGEPRIRLFDHTTNQEVASVPVPFKGKENVATGTHEFASPSPGLYAAQLLYDNVIVSTVDLTVTADRDGDKTPDSSDGCADDPLKTDPGVCGCGTPDSDTDGDAVLDCFDGCPSDSLKTDAGFCGCGFLESFADQDNDGLSDCYDACPADPVKQRPLVCGCGTPDTDTDGDATPDCKDECAADPAKSTQGVCGCGIAETDGDADKTPDCKDACPADPVKIAPGMCGCGTRERFDVATFRDGKGYACSAWKGFDCTQAAEKWGYTQAQETAILANCSLTCARCPLPGA